MTGQFLGTCTHWGSGEPMQRVGVALVKVRTPSVPRLLLFPDSGRAGVTREQGSPPCGLMGPCPFLGAWVLCPETQMEVDTGQPCPAP